MAGYKRQHWLPASYLKFFAIEGIDQGRNSRVWATDRDTRTIKKASNVAVSFWTYSRSNAKEAEESFAEMERDYPELVDRVNTNDPIGKRDQLLLTAEILELHFRNAKYEIAGFTDESSPKDMHAHLAVTEAGTYTVSLYADVNVSGDVSTDLRDGSLEVMFIPNN